MNKNNSKAGGKKRSDTEEHASERASEHASERANGRKTKAKKKDSNALNDPSNLAGAEKNISEIVSEWLPNWVEAKY